MAEKKEFWENRTKSTFWVQVTDHKGDTDSKKVIPGARLDITPSDRQINQMICVDKANDWFANGALSPVTLVEDAEDYATIKANPNTLSESEILDLLKLPTNKLKPEIAKMDSVFAIQVLYDYVTSEEADSAEGLSMAKVKAVQERYEELNPPRTGVKVTKTFEESGPINGD